MIRGEKMDRKKKSLVIILIVLLTVGILSSIALYFLEKAKQQEEQNNVQEEVIEDEKDEVVLQDAIEEEEVVIPIDFTHWKGINEDIYAWISIADTNIEYPILQHPTDNAYYLDHTVEHVAGLPGSIYTENRNAKDFNDFNTLIYGHNMKDGTMFKHLHKFKEQEFFDTHDTIMVYTETEVLTYKVYAAVVYNDKHILVAFDNDSVEDRQAFIQSLHDINSSKKLFREGMTIDENSQLITLSTCTGDSNTRLIVVAEKVVD